MGELRADAVTGALALDRARSYLADQVRPDTEEAVQASTVEQRALSREVAKSAGFLPKWGCSGAPIPMPVEYRNFWIKDRSLRFSNPIRKYGCGKFWCGSCSVGHQQADRQRAALLIFDTLSSGGSVHLIESTLRLGVDACSPDDHRLSGDSEAIGRAIEALVSSWSSTVTQSTYKRAKGTDFHRAVGVDYDRASGEVIVRQVVVLATSAGTSPRTVRTIVSRATGNMESAGATVRLNRVEHGIGPESWARAALRSSARAVRTMPVTLLGQYAARRRGRRKVEAVFAALAAATDDRRLTRTSQGLVARLGLSRKARPAQDRIALPRETQRWMRSEPEGIALNTMTDQKYRSYATTSPEHVRDEFLRIVGALSNAPGDAVVESSAGRRISPSAALILLPDVTDPSPLDRLEAVLWRALQEAATTQGSPPSDLERHHDAGPCPVPPANS